MESNQFGSILRHLKFDVYQTSWEYFQLAGNATGKFIDKEAAIQTRLQIESLCHMLKVPAVVKVIQLPQSYAAESDEDTTYVVSIWVNLDDE